MRNGAWIYDTPIWKDWLIYVTAFAVLAVLIPLPSNVFDLTLAVASQVFIFGVLPSFIRSWIRSRRVNQE